MRNRILARFLQHWERRCGLESGYYAALTGLLAQSQTLDSVAGNLANAGTAGFRAERDYFRDAIVGANAGNSQVNGAINNYGVLGGTMLDLAQGPIQQTGNPLDLAIQGQGFFAIRTANGVRYTRDGELMRATNGELVTADGMPVLNLKDKPIVLPAGKPVIGTDGTVSVDGAAVGQIGVFEFGSANELAAEGVGRYVPVGKAKPTAARGFSIRQGALEGSNQDVIHGTMDLIFAERQGQMMQKALSIFYNDFNKSATEELPKA
jgi:flagellar basal-body rod protein FlgF/flagellar basal-body rod protein FlgG